MNIKYSGVNIIRKKRDSGKDSFELTPEKANKLHDDRAYCLAMCAYLLSQKRFEGVRNKKKDVDENLMDFFKIRKPEQASSYFR